MELKTSRELLGRWLLALGCFALLLFCFSPPWAAFRAWARVPELVAMLEVRRGASVLWQIDHPGAPIPDALHGAIQWRLLFPAIGRVLPLPPPMFFALAHLGGIVVLAFVITFLRRARAGWLESGLAAIVFGAGGWFFASVGWLGYFDAWVVFGLLLVSFARRPWAVWAACLWAPWIDERFALAAPLALLCRWLQHPGAGNDWDKRRDLVVPAALVGGFLVVRLVVLGGSSGTNATIDGYLGQLNVLDAPLARFAFGIWEGLRAGWLFVAAATLLAWPRRFHALVLAGAVVAIVCVGLLTAQDFGRSMMFVTPVIVLGLTRALAIRPAWLPWALRTAAFATLILPAHHVMSDRVNPIFYLYHELAALRSPPAAIMPELYELRAIRALQRGDLARAEADLELAIRLASNPSGSLQQRGVMYATQGRWTDAQRDFAAMVQHDPANPDGWFFRAQAALALGDATAAHADMQRALELAPPEWAARPDVARFQERLLRQTDGR